MGFISVDVAFTNLILTIFASDTLEEAIMTPFSISDLGETETISPILAFEIVISQNSFK